MNDRLHYGTPESSSSACRALLAVQLSIGWFMPDVHANPPRQGYDVPYFARLDNPGVFFVAACLAYLTHTVAPESSLPPWQRVSSQAIHWLLYLLVFVATITGWLFASFRGWSVSYFDLIPLPMLAAKTWGDPSDRRLASNCRVGTADRNPHTRSAQR